ncbi:sigma-70 family RNA polymerase sigma factor [Rubritalea tangerina]
MLSNSQDADDILQETNTYILTHLDKFDRGSNFKAWAFQIAYFRVKSHIRDRQRRNHVDLSDALVEKISHAAATYFNGDDERLSHLHRCIQKLGTKERLLLRLQYMENASLTELAKTTMQKPNSIHKAMSRIRQSLRFCIEKQHSQQPA